MAKFNIKGTKSVINNIRKTFDKITKQKSMKAKIGIFSVNRILSVTRSGKSIVTGRRFKKLKKSTTESNKYKNPKDEFYIPGSKSNLTLTGQLLKALKWKVSEGELQVYIAETSRSDSSSTNADVAKYVRQNGRAFLGMDEKGKKRIKKIVLDEVRRQLKKSGFKKQ